MAEGIHFKSADHKQRFLDAVEKLGEQYDNHYGAALYILTADPATWRKASGYISDEGIVFARMLEEQDWSGGYRALIRIAGNLFNPEATSAAPVDLLPLDEDNFHLAIDAIKLRRYGWHSYDWHSSKALG